MSFETMQKIPDHIAERIGFNPTTLCWPWRGAIMSAGYGNLYLGKIGGKYRWSLAHRYIYEKLVGPIPAGDGYHGMTIDHLCRNRACVNPAHMETVPQRENLLRGKTIPARNSKKTHCPQGHIYDYFWSRNGSRRCSTCNRAHARKWQVENRDKYNAQQRAGRLRRKAGL